jgi:hypothetical protein
LPWRAATVVPASPLQLSGRNSFFVHFFSVPASISVGAAVFVFRELVLASPVSCSWSPAARLVASSLVFILAFYYFYELAFGRSKN